MKVEPLDLYWKCASEGTNLWRKSKLWTTYWVKGSFEGRIYELARKNKIKK
jgi:hypothetical protein